MKQISEAQNLQVETICDHKSPLVAVSCDNHSEGLKRFRVVSHDKIPSYPNQYILEQC